MHHLIQSDNMRKPLIAILGVAAVMVGVFTYIGVSGTQSNTPEPQRTEVSTETTGEESEENYDVVAKGDYTDEETALERIKACEQDYQCAVAEIKQFAVTAGPEKALSVITKATPDNPLLETNCHAIYEAVGRAVVATNGLSSYRNSGCQFGYTHGVLYALAKVYKSVDEMLPDVIEYCGGFLHDYDSLSGPDNTCMHGVGHALAGLTYDDPKAAANHCVRAFKELFKGPEEYVMGYIENCIDGVFMEYGDGNLVRLGFMEQTSAAISTNADPSTMVKVCESLEQQYSIYCYSRLWKFIGAGSKNPAEAAKTCTTAREERAGWMCRVGFGELVAWENPLGRDGTWPPATVKDAETYAKKTIEICSKHPILIDCIYGVMASATSHLYAVDYEASLIPNMCKYVDKSILEQCLKHEEDVKRLNWNKTDGAGTESGSGA